MPIEWSYNHLDIVFALIVVIAMIRAAMRGFVTELLSTAAVVLGILAAVLFSAPLSVYVSRLLGESMWSQIIAFLVLFIVVYLAVKLIEGLLHRGIEALSLRKLDSVLGLLLGALEGLLVVCVVLFVLYIQPFFDAGNILEESLSARLILPLLVPAFPSRILLLIAIKSIRYYI
jgi:membrane protein required for colicin V production